MIHNQLRDRDICICARSQHQPLGNYEFIVNTPIAKVLKFKTLTFENLTGTVNMCTINRGDC